MMRFLLNFWCFKRKIPFSFRKFTSKFKPSKAISFKLDEFEHISSASVNIPIVKCCRGVIGDSSENSQKPLYSKLKQNIFKTQDKCPISILRLLPSHTSIKIVSGASSKGRSSAFWQVTWRNLIIVNSWFRSWNNINVWHTVIITIRKKKFYEVFE